MQLSTRSVVPISSYDWGWRTAWCVAGECREAAAPGCKIVAVSIIHEFVGIVAPLPKVYWKWYCRSLCWRTSLGGFCWGSGILRVHYENKRDPSLHMFFPGIFWVLCMNIKQARAAIYFSAVHFVNGLEIGL